MNSTHHHRNSIRSDFLIALLGVVLAFAGTTKLYAQVSEEERQALIRFYHATGGDEWHDNSGWLSDSRNECNWFGVQCAGQQSGTPFVFRLMVPDNNLVGQLPDSLAELDRLASLVVSDNKLTGSISPNLWGLSSLEDLFLGQNQFSGKVPASILTMAEGMPRSQANLSGNMLDSFDTGPIPDGPLGREIELRLNDNLFERLPPASWQATGAIYSLEMSNNRLEGALSLSEPWPELNLLDLSENRITEINSTGGDLFPDLFSLDIADNDIAEWPSLLPALGHMTELDLSNNALAGELPEWIGELDLAALDLDNNDLTGPIADVFQALDLDDFPDPGPHGELGLRLHVANNRFSGALPDIDYGSFNTPFQGQSPDFGLDLCFNDIEMPAAGMLEAINPVHRGLELQSCIDREQASLDPTISGSWYQPERSGEGVTMMLLDNGQLLNYWFTYAPQEEEDQESEQMWLVGVTDPADTYGEFKPLWTTSGGQFSEGLADGSSRASNTWIRQNRIDQDTQHFFYDYRGNGFCITGACFWDVFTGRFDQTRLSELAGTTCDNQSPFQRFSGAWYDPERNGEGLIVEVLPDDRVVVYWFTYAPDGSGNQAWMTGQGTFENVGLTITPQPEFPFVAEVDMYQPQGTGFGRDFDSDEIEVVDWGSMELQFRETGDGRIIWNSELESFGNGEYPIERLARPMLANCPQGGAR